MKTILKLAGIILTAGLLATACSKDSNNGNTGKESEKTMTSLVIYDSTSSTTRAAGADELIPDATESTVNTSAGVKVAVFNDDDSFNSFHTLTLSGTGPYTSSEFEIAAGEKYFYVFLNDASSRIPTATSAVTRNEYITSVLNVALSGTDVLDIATGDFLLGTLWSAKKTAPGGGVTGTPMTVSVTVGRLSSKVLLESVAQGAGSNMAGTFSGFNYRLGSVPKMINIVGDFDETQDAPPANGHGIVYSAVHNEAPTVTGGAYNSAAYNQYANTWKTPGNLLANTFYTAENTTEPDGSGLQYYGNTTYIQIESVYDPADSEVYDVEDPTINNRKADMVGATFYTARIISTGETLVFAKDPRVTANNPSADIQQSSVKVFTDGKNYHKFPVYDPQSGLPEVQKNAVLRNHAYLYKVTTILNLGENESDVDPEEPIETPTTLELEVTIANWSKIEDDGVII